MSQPNPSPSTTPFKFPTYHASYPPFFTLQTNTSILTAQYRKWSRLIQRYCRHHRLYKLSLTSTIDSPLFRNTELKKRLSLQDARSVLEWMSRDEGGRRIEWVDQKGRGADARPRENTHDTCWVFWKRPEEWGDVIAAWVEGTGQKGVVLTFYELLNGEGTRGEEFHGMDQELFQRALSTLVKKGKAQVFGSEGAEGIRFF